MRAVVMAANLERPADLRIPVSRQFPAARGHGNVAAARVDRNVTTTRVDRDWRAVGRHLHAIVIRD